MEKRGIRNPWDLTEFDADWVNPATRQDIKEVSEKHGGKVFGLKFWREWTVLRGEDLLDCGNFDVDVIFRDEDEAKVKKLIEDYEPQSKGGWSGDLGKIVDALFNLAIESCTWV